MILIISDYSYNDGGIIKGNFYQILLYFKNNKFYKKSKEFSQDPNNIYPSHSLPQVQEITEKEILDYKNFLPVGETFLIEAIKDNEIVYKFYRNPYKNIHSYILTKILKPYQIDW